mmetsp:Transcript_5313/g.15802  ORF Transcript_5313/g.15802 Transcript_5313/m.15802 type:complete len:230 (-) Transcript_5313:84-773(-)
MRVHQPDHPLLWGTTGRVQCRAVDVVHVAEQPQSLDAHPPSVLHHPVPTLRILDDVSRDPLYALAHVHPDKLLLPLFVRAHRAHAYSHGLLRRHLVLTREQLELDVLVGARDELALGRGLETQVVGDCALCVRVPGDVLLSNHSQREQGRVVLLSALVSQGEGDDIMPGLHNTPTTLFIHTESEAHKTRSLCYVADTAVCKLRPRLHGAGEWAGQAHCDELAPGVAAVQ